MAIIVSAPDAFYDAEPWEFDLTVNELDGSAPMNLTGSELFVRFVSLSDNVSVGVCNTAAANGSLTIVEPAAGKVRVSVPSQGRTWRLSAVRPGALLLPSEPTKAGAVINGRTTASVLGLLTVGAGAFDVKWHAIGS